MIHRCPLGFGTGPFSTMLFFMGWGLFAGAVLAQENPASDSPKAVLRFLDVDADYLYYAKAEKFVDKVLNAALLLGEFCPREIEEARGFADNADLDEIGAFGYSHKTHAEGIDLNLVVAKSAVANPANGPWNIFPKTASPLAGIQRLPNDSVWAVYGHLDAEALLAYVLKLRPRMAESYAQIEAEGGYDVTPRQLAAALSGTSWGCALTMDPEKRQVYPFSKRPLPMVGFVATFDSPRPVLRELLLKRIGQSLGEPERRDMEGASIEWFPAIKGVPGEPQIHLVTIGDSLTLTTSRELALQMGGVGLVSPLAEDPDFRALRGRLPSDGSPHFLHYISPRLGTMLASEEMLEVLEVWDLEFAAPFFLSENGTPSGIAFLTHGEAGFHLAARANGPATPLVLGAPLSMEFAIRAFAALANLDSAISSDLTRQGKNIYTIIMADALSDKVVEMPSGHASATEYFNDLCGSGPNNTSIPVVRVPSILSGRTTPAASLPLTPENVGWCIVDGHRPSTEVGVPFLFTCNLEFTEDHKPKVNLGTPYGDLVVIITHGAGAQVFRAADPELPMFFERLPNWDPSKVLRP